MDDSVIIDSLSTGVMILTVSFISFDTKKWHRTYLKYLTVIQLKDALQFRSANMNNFVDSLYPSSVQQLNLSQYECQVDSVDPQSGKIPFRSPGSSVPGVRPGQMVKLTTFPPAVVEPCHSESAQQQPKQTKTWTELQRDLEVLSNSWDDLTWVSRDWICYQWVLNHSQGGREQPTQWDCLIP